MKLNDVTTTVIFNKLDLVYSRTTEYKNLSHMLN